MFTEYKLYKEYISVKNKLFSAFSFIIPLSEITKLLVRRTLFMRLIGVKEVRVYTRRPGKRDKKRRFFLRKDAPLPFSAPCSACIRPRFRELLFGAFIDTRALGGIFVFASALRRLSRIFGETPVRKIRELLELTADNLGTALVIFRVVLPRIFLTAAAFALGSWAFVYALRVVSLARLRVCPSRDIICIRSGLITLYERYLVPNVPAVSCDTFTTVLSKRAPLYLHKELLLPCVRREKLPKAIKTLFGSSETELPEKPRKASFKDLTKPFVFATIFLIGNIFAPLDTFKSLSGIGTAVSLFVCFLYLLYIRRARNEPYSVIKGLRLYTTVISRQNHKRQPENQKTIYPSRAARHKN